MTRKKKVVAKKPEIIPKTDSNIYYLEQRVENQRPFVKRAEEYLDTQKQRLAKYEKELAEALEKQ